MNAAETKTLFTESFKNITRPGADKLWEYLSNSTFFDDPASTRYHLSCHGGLCRHSLNVYNRLVQLLAAHEKETGEHFEPETVAVVALLHDLCKMGTYSVTTRNQKTYDPAKVADAPGYMVKHDNMGDFIWESLESYVSEDPFPYGHGEKSVYLLQKFIWLTDEEAMAIRFHMGAWKDADKRDAGKVFEGNSLAFFLHVADEYATYIDES